MNVIKSLSINYYLTVKFVSSPIIFNLWVCYSLKENPRTRNSRFKNEKWITDDENNRYSGIYEFLLTVLILKNF